jgi:hypothetical protein
VFLDAFGAEPEKITNGCNVLKFLTFIMPLAA